VFSTLFPHPGQPQAGIFIRERMFRVGKHLPLVVVAPVPWFPLQGLIRLWRPHFRPPAPAREEQQGFEVLHPRFFSIPGVAKSLDGIFLALSTYNTLRNLKRRFRFNLIDAHFGYPDGYAATLLGRWLKVPVTITLRGTESRHSQDQSLRPKLVSALNRASRVFSVSDSLRQLAIKLGIEESKTRVVGNGVDTEKFQPVSKDEARQSLNLPRDAKVLITVGGLCERKGFHRVIECLPQLIERYPNLHYLIVGGPSAEGDWTDRLKEQVQTLGLTDQVHFLGTISPEKLKLPLSAADVFVLATRNEGWANVLLEAMACGLPVVTTDVGGNAEVVCRTDIGMVVPFGDQQALSKALKQAFDRDWVRQDIINYASNNSWDQRVEVLRRNFSELVNHPG
jgi:glycosyltransferase involved in cell wall biosynthesis